MELTQSEAAEYFLTQWPEELQDYRQKEFYKRTRERLDSKYSFIGKLSPRNEYQERAAWELARDPENPETEQAYKLKNEVKETAFNGVLDEEEFAKWDMEWMNKNLPFIELPSRKSKFSSTIGSRKVYVWGGLEIGYENDGKYAAFGFDPLEDRNTLKNLMSELDNEIVCKTVYPTTASEDIVYRSGGWYEIENLDDPKIKADIESLNIKFQEDSIDQAEEVLDILDWEDQTSQIELSQNSQN